MKKRYVGLFITPHMCDGIYDTWNDPGYDNPLDFDKIIEIMNDSNNQTKVWQNKYDEMKEKYLKLKNKSKEDSGLSHLEDGL